MFNKQKLFKLNNSRFTHHILLGAVVTVIAAAVGLNAYSISYAAPFNTSSGLTCKVTGMPKTITTGQSVPANIVIYNTNDKTVTSKIEATLGEYKANGKSKGGGFRSYVTVPADGSSTESLGSITVGNGFTKVEATGQGFNSPHLFNCEKTVDVS